MTNRNWALALWLCFITGCTGLPKNVVPVSDFDAERYLGTWYEIARLDHRFERGLSNVTATYTPRDDGGIVVENRGYSTKKGEWQDATGKAYFVGDRTTGHLKVSFFGPFYGSYAVFELDKSNYQYAFVSGNSTSYLWLLSRTPEVDPSILDAFKSRAEQLEFDTSELIMVNHEPVGE